MSHFVSFTSAKNGQVHGKAKGSVPTLGELTIENEKNSSGVVLDWRFVKLTEITLDTLTDAVKKNWRDALGVVDGSTETLATIAIGNVENDQRARLRSALQLVDTNVVIKGVLADDRSKIIYFGGNLFGVKRLLYSDVTSINERSGYESSGVAKAISGTGATSMASASNQWLTFNFAARNVFSIKLRHTNNNWANRKLNINYAAKSLTALSGTYTYSYLPVTGFQSISRLQIVDDGGDTEILDLQVLYSDNTSPTLTNGQVLTTGDFFRVDGSPQILEFKGTHQGSGAWYAVPSSNNINIDSALSEISTNSLQNRVITASLEELRRTLGDRIDAIGIVDELQSWIEKQLLLNALVINRLSTVFDEIEILKKSGNS